MDTNTVFTKIQQFTKDVPLILIGTSGTIPYGIPGMYLLESILRLLCHVSRLALGGFLLL